MTALFRVLVALSTAAVFGSATGTASAAPATPPPSASDNEVPLGMLEIGMSPVASQVWLRCALCGRDRISLDTGSLGGGVTAGFRYGGFLLSAYGEFGRGLEGQGASHTAIGALAQFGFSSVPIAFRTRLFHDIWVMSGGSQPTRHLSGFGAGVDVVIGSTKPSAHNEDDSLGWEVIVGTDVSDLGTYTDLAGPSDVDGHAVRLLFGLRLTFDTRLGCTRPCVVKP